MKPKGLGLSVLKELQKLKLLNTPEDADKAVEKAGLNMKKEIRAMMDPNSKVDFDKQNFEIILPKSMQDLKLRGESL